MTFFTATKKFQAILLLCFLTTTALSQSVTNGNFSNSSTGWGCGPETYPESTYGGSTSNRVAEIDASAGRCQTISGFTVGNIYNLTFKFSRRTTCGPTLQSMDVTLSDGALNSSVSRDGTSFSLATESFNFTATSTSHTLTFEGTTSGTCGLIIDDVAISFVALPVNLISFDATVSTGNIVSLKWETASELNNDFFTLEHSPDGQIWNEIAAVQGSGTTHEVVSYSYEHLPTATTNSYRLSQTDYDGTTEDLGIRTVKTANKFVNIYPNPASSKITVELNSKIFTSEKISIYSSAGVLIKEKIIKRNSQNRNISIDINDIKTGTYLIKIGTEISKLTVIR
ncbi:T9SS type A sorting domain-containing protein [Bacteroidia bacterium]|nr:T9SS type A sorting domain-containing protein [Bacteroidia bacterium]